VPGRPRASGDVGHRTPGGGIEGQQEAKGIRVSFEDLLIGSTALHLNYSVATFNVRHFQQIPGLSVGRL
jgi:predicted nucleic acid-binding protein